MDVPRADIDLCREAHARLRRAVEPLTDADVAAPSLLPGWSVGHLLTHLARNADSVLRRLDGALRDEVVDQYPGGLPARAAEIEAGAGRGAAELGADVVATADAVDAALIGFPADRWDRLGRTAGGVEQPVATLPFARAREVEVHLVDLGRGHEPADWPPELAERWLPELLRALPDRTDPTALLAWVLRRGPSPALGPF
jgi:maleylpyruvate isomerase